MAIGAPYILNMINPCPPFNLGVDGKTYKITEMQLKDKFFFFKKNQEINFKNRLLK